MHKKIIRRLSCVSLSLFLSFGCCVFNPIADLSISRPLIVHADGGAVSVKRKILEYISMLLASGQIALSNIAQNAPEYWENLKGLISTYSTVNNITDEQWEEINNNIELGNETITAVGGEAANKLNGFMEWLRTTYDLSGFIDAGQNITPIFVDGSSYSNVIAHYKFYYANSFGKPTYFATCDRNMRVTAIGNKSKTSFYIVFSVDSDEDTLVYGWFAKTYIRKDSPLIEGNPFQWYTNLSQGKFTNSPNVSTVLINDSDFSYDYVRQHYSEYMFGPNAIHSIDAVTPYPLPASLPAIDANKSYELSLKNMHDIDIWKDADLSSEEGIEQAINKSIENPASIDVGNDISMPVAYPLNIPADNPALKIPITVGKEIPIDTPIPTAVPTSVPTAVPTVDPFPAGTTGSDYGVLGLNDVFPFCIPFDIYNILSAFCATPETPEFTWNSPYGDVSFDFHKFDDIAFWWRKALVILFLIWLLQSSRSSSLGD